MREEILPGENKQLIAETKVLIARNKELIDKLCQMTELVPFCTGCESPRPEAHPSVRLDAAREG